MVLYNFPKMLHHTGTVVVEIDNVQPIDAETSHEEGFTALVDAAGVIIDWCIDKAESASVFVSEKKRLNKALKVAEEGGAYAKFKRPIEVIRQLRATDIDTL